MRDDEEVLILRVGTVIDGIRALPALSLGAALDLATGGPDPRPDPDLPTFAPGGAPAPEDPWHHALWTAECSAPELLEAIGAGHDLPEVAQRAAALRQAVADFAAAPAEAPALGRLAREAVIPAAADFVATVRAVHAASNARTDHEDARRARRGLHEVSRIGRQIHMISVNASIEAARAGPAGRGFAVIGDEIRDLAAESAKVLRRLQDQIGATAPEGRGPGPVPTGVPVPAALPPPS